MVLLLDGGFSTELESNPWNKNLTSKLWSAAVLAEDPESIEAVHLSYLNAGCDIITSSSYQGSIPSFISVGYIYQDAVKLLQSSVDLAISAIMKYKQTNPTLNPKLAISIGCYGAFLADGSEYNGAYGDISRQELHDFHKSKLEILLQAKSLSKIKKADLYIAFETIPSELEALAIADLCALPILEHIKVWVSFCCKDECHLTGGSRIVDAASHIPQNVIVGVNCCKPELISSLLSEIGSRPKIAYGNSGQEYFDGKWQGESKGYAEMATRWISDPHLAIVGGWLVTSLLQLQNNTKRHGRNQTVYLVFFPINIDNVHNLFFCSRFS